MANVVNFGAESERRRVEITQQTVGKSRVLAEQFFDRGVIETRRLQACRRRRQTGLLAGISSAEHGRLAKEKARVVGVAESFGVLKLGFGFDFFSEKMDTAREIAVGNFGAQIVIGQTGIHFEELDVGDERLPFRFVEKIVESENVVVGDESDAEFDEFGSGANSFENFQDDFFGERSLGTSRWRAAASTLKKAMELPTGACMSKSMVEFTITSSATDCPGRK